MTSYFAILAMDGPDSAGLRQQHREGHLAHFRANADKLAVAGPLTGDQAGSLVIVRAESEAEAEAFIRQDPFHHAGVWESIQIFPFRPASGVWAAS
jgi:uncharacterized protein YciI